MGADVLVAPLGYPNGKDYNMSGLYHSYAGKLYSKLIILVSQGIIRRFP